MKKGWNWMFWVKFSHFLQITQTNTQNLQKFMKVLQFFNNLLQKLIILYYIVAKINKESINIGNSFEALI